MKNLINNVVYKVKKRRLPFCKVCYFHNFSRFDGILLIKHLKVNQKYKLKPLMKKGILYELVVSISGRRKKLFRDSLKLLPGSLNSLA